MPTDAEGPYNVLDEKTLAFALVWTERNVALEIDAPKRWVTRCRQNGIVTPERRLVRRVPTYVYTPDEIEILRRRRNSGIGPAVQAAKRRSISRNT